MPGTLLAFGSESAERKPPAGSKSTNWGVPLPSRTLGMLVDVGLNAVSRERGEFELERLDSIEPPD